MDNASARWAGSVEVADKRLLRGARTRQVLLRRAVDIASLDGLDGISFGRLAAETELSKAGVQTLFRSKETLQLATLAYGRELFVDAVVGPTRSAAGGVPRLRSLVNRWLRYVTAPLFAGGCLWVANLPAYDGRRGPVHDALFDHHREWLDTIAGELRQALSDGQLADMDADLTAFQIDAVLSAGNTALRAGDSRAGRKVRRIIDAVLAPRPEGAGTPVPPPRTR